MPNHQNNLANKVAVWLPLLLAGVLALGLYIGLQLNNPVGGQVLQNDEQNGLYLNGTKGRVDEMMHFIEAKYVDEEDPEILVRKALRAIIGELDPHSNYIPVEDLQAINDQLDGDFDGIGVEFMVLDDTIVVVSPLSGGPSEAVGIRAGDKIIRIEDSIVAGVNLSSQDIFSLLRGPKGTEVEIGIKRAGQQNLLSFTITRAKIPMHSVDVAIMLDEKTGYIKINRFSATTYDEFVMALERLVEKHKMEDIVVDLRHNPGGYLKETTRMLSQVFPQQGKLLVYTEGRTVKRTEYKSNGRPFYPIGEVIVLIDEGSASASEIFAGAVQDHDRGVIIGRRSFGKGLVQEQYPLRDGSALRLTVARYYTPSGRCIQKPYGHGEDYSGDLEERYHNGELSEEDKMAIPDSTRFYTDNGYVVYGGGGIMPDIFIPLDTTVLQEEYLIWRQYTSGFVFRYAEQHQNPFKNYDLDRFVSTYTVSNNLYQSYLDYTREQGVEQDFPQTPAVIKELKRFLKARLARQYFKDEGFFKVWNQDDAMVQKALEVLREDDPIAAARKE